LTFRILDRPLIPTVEKLVTLHLLLFKTQKLEAMTEQKISSISDEERKKLRQARFAVTN